MMAQHGTFLVPTLAAGEAVESAAKSGRLTGLRAEKALAAAHGDAARRSSIADASMASRSRSAPTPASATTATNGHEFRLMVEWGGHDADAGARRRHAQRRAAAGLGGPLGTLAPGKWADVVAVPGDPTTGHHGDGARRRS